MGLNKDGSIKEPVNYDETLNERDGVSYTKETNKPYSGQVFSLYDHGMKKAEGTIKDGKKDGLWTDWYQNGQKEREITYKDGNLDGLYSNWYENGQKMTEDIHKDGKLISEKYWNSDGSLMND